MEYNRLYAKIDLDAIGKNVAEVRKRIPERTKIMAIIKANAYGHGAITVAEYLEEKADWFGVATLDEALELRRSGVQKDILVLGSLDPAEFRAAAENGITLTIATLANAEKLSAVCCENGISANIHIKLDTGMSRIGFRPDEKSLLEVEKISCLQGLKITGIFTHFAIADIKDKTSAKAQRELYDSFVSVCRERGIDIPLCHINNSAGTMELDRHYDMVRMGIMLYGLYPSEEMDKSFPLYPAMELIGHVSFVKDLEKGRGVSYGHTFIADKDMKVATVTCGYADGYPRCLSNRFCVLISGERCPIIGRVCMDQLMVDISGVDNVKMGDEVVLVGKMGDEFIPVEEPAELAYSFNYEFVCGIAGRVPRVYYKNGVYYKTSNYLLDK